MDLSAAVLLDTCCIPAVPGGAALHLTFWLMDSYQCGQTAKSGNKLEAVKVVNN